MTNLVECALSAPLIGVTPKDRRTLHAVTMEAVVAGWRFTKAGKVRADLRFDAACGVKRVQLVGQAHQPVPWPPYAPEKPIVRCVDCYRLTGKTRPCVRFVTKVGYVA